VRWRNPPRELSRTAFVSDLDAMTAVYAAAMRPDPEQLPGRRSIMQQHASHIGFRALVVTADVSGHPDSPGCPGNPGYPGHPDNPGHRDGHGRHVRLRPGRIIAFSYGFSCADGQWWHDIVAAVLTARNGAAVATAWLADSLEIAEVHVHPDFHRRGIGRSLVLGLADGRPERTAVLSTPDADTPARRLYHGLGFADLLTGYNFPGSSIRYAVMGATLPLRPAAGAGYSSSWRA
jgi:GNAT superfamily N-acetyltransferase